MDKQIANVYYFSGSDSLKNKCWKTLLEIDVLKKLGQTECNTMEKKKEKKLTVI